MGGSKARFLFASAGAALLSQGIYAYYNRAGIIVGCKPAKYEVEE